MTKSRYAILFLAFLLSIFLFVGTASTVKFRKEFTKNNKKEQGHYIPAFSVSGSVAVAIFLVLFAGIGVASATDYYVTLSGNNTNNGTTPDTAWRTITYAANQIQAGDTVYIEGGNYGHEHVVISNSGTAGNPIVFQGIGGSASIDGSDGYGYGFGIETKSYITLKNLKALHYERGFHVTGSNIIMDNVEATENYYYGIHILSSSNISLLNSLVQDDGMCGVGFKNTHDSLIENVTAIGTQNPIPRDSDNSGMGYYIIIAYSHNNTIRDSIAKNNRAYNASFHPGHGIGIKDDPSGGVYVYPNSYNNTFYNLSAIGIAEPFVFAHYAHNNTLYNFSVDSSTLTSSKVFYGLTIRDGASNNTIHDGTVTGNSNVYSMLQLSEGTEHAGIDYNDNNLIYNVIFNKTAENGIWIEYSRNNTFRNLVFVGGTTSTLFYNAAGENNNKFINSIITNFTTLGTSNLTFTYSDFWNNGFNTPSGTGNINSDPLFANPAKGDFHEKSQYGRWNGTQWIYDTVTSPGIDAGDPVSIYSNEPSPNGGRINMGAYGNTREASLSGISIISHIPNQPVVTGFTSDSTQFSVESSSIGNFTWYLNGTVIQTNNLTTSAVYTNTTPSVGTWNLTVIVTDNLSSSDSFEWTWIVSTSDTYTSSGYVTDSLGNPINNVSLVNGSYSATTNSNGYFLITNLSTGSYNFTLSKSGFNTNYKIITIPSSSVTNDYFSYFDFNTTSTAFVNDLNTTTNHNGTLINMNLGIDNNSGGMYSGWNSSGKYGNGISFDGVNDFITFTHNGTFNTSNWTIMFWAKPNGTQVAIDGIITTYTCCLSGFNIRFGSTNKLWTRWGYGTGYSNFDTVTAVTANIWTHVAYVYNGTNYTPYFNGVPETPKAAGGTYLPLLTEIWYIGNDDGNTSRAYTGILDEIRIYNRTLSTSDIIEAMSPPVIASDLINQNVTLSDTTPPDQVTELALTYTNSNMINISWSIISEAHSYRIYRNDSIVGNTTDNFFSDNGLTTKTWYQYKVQANDSYDNWGVNSSAVDIKTNNAPIQVSIGDKNINESETLEFQINSSDADGDPLAYATDAIYGTLNATGYYLWVTNFTSANAEIYSWTFNTTDNDSAVATETITVIVNNANPTIFDISFIDPTPENASTNTTENIFINTSVTNGTDGTAWLDWGLVGNWRMNEATGKTLVEDSSRYQNNGTWVGNTTSNVTIGKYGNGLDFDGTNDYVNVSGFSGIFEEFTISAWIKVDNYSNYRKVFDLGASGTGKRVFLQIYTNGMTFDIDASAGGQATYDTTDTEFIYLVGQWKNNSFIRLYANRLLVGSNATPVLNQSLVINASDNKFIGARATFLDHYFDGIIDDIKIYNRIISTDEINASYDAGSYRLSNNFTGLADGDYNFTGYIQNATGIINQTDKRYVTVNAAGAGTPNITSWGNNKTNNDILSITINTSESVNFNATANQTITTWNWAINGSNQSVNYDNYTNSWTTTGLRNISVNGSNANGTSNTIYWNVTVNAAEAAEAQFTKVEFLWWD